MRLCTGNKDIYGYKDIYGVHGHIWVNCMHHEQIWDIRTHMGYKAYTALYGRIRLYMGDKDIYGYNDIYGVKDIYGV